MTIRSGREMFRNRGVRPDPVTAEAVAASGLARGAALARARDTDSGRKLAARTALAAAADLARAEGGGGS